MRKERERQGRSTRQTKSRDIVMAFREPPVCRSAGQADRPGRLDGAEGRFNIFYRLRVGVLLLLLIFQWCAVGSAQ